MIVHLPFWCQFKLDKINQYMAKTQRQFL